MKFEIQNKKISIVILSLILATFVASLVLFISFKKGTRRTFVFPSVESGVRIIETRIIPDSYLDPVEYYINELLLGPQSERTRNIFADGTKVLSFIRKNKTIYIDLSKDMINPATENQSIPIREGITLLKENIRRNFPGITSIEVFVEGNPVYEGY